MSNSEKTKNTTRGEFFSASVDSLKFNENWNELAFSNILVDHVLY